MLNDVRDDKYWEPKVQISLLFQTHDYVNWMSLDVLQETLPLSGGHMHFMTSDMNYNIKGVNVLLYCDCDNYNSLYINLINNSSAISASTCQHLITAILQSKIPIFNTIFEN